MTTIYYGRAKARALEILAEPRPGAWVLSTAPNEAELDAIARDYKLERDNLNDAVDLYEAPRVEVDGGIVYLYLRYCHPEGKEIATEPVLIVYSRSYLLTITRIKTGLFDRLVNQPGLVTTQRTKAMLQLLGEVNLSYERQLNRFAKQILRIRGQMRQSRLNTREFLSIIELEEDLNEFLSALQPQAILLSALTKGKYLGLQEADRDNIEDLARDTGELIEQLRGRLRTLGNMRQAYDAIATTNLNNTFKRLTSIAIFLTIPTIVGGLWGMNVNLPYEHGRYAFAVVIGVIGVLEVGTIWFFNRKQWL